MLRLIVTLWGLTIAGSQVFAQDLQKQINTSMPKAGYLEYVHPLGLGQNPNSAASGYAYLLIAEGAASAPERSKAACKALFSTNGRSAALAHAPAQESGDKQMLTYWPINKTGDFTRVSALFKWGLCNNLSAVVDLAREQSIRTQLAYPAVLGPLLVAFDQTVEGAALAERAFVVDLSLVRDEDLPQAIENWRSSVAPNTDLWKRGAVLKDLQAKLVSGMADNAPLVTAMRPFSAPDASSLSDFVSVR